MGRKEEMNEFIAEYVNNYDGDSYEASAEREDIAVACKSSIQWADKTMIDKACEWLESVNLDYYQIREGVFSKELVTDFRKAMEE